MKRDPTRAKKMNDQNDLHELTLANELELMLENNYVESTPSAPMAFPVTLHQLSAALQQELIKLEDVRQESAVSAALLGHEKSTIDVMAGWEPVGDARVELMSLEESACNLMSRLHAHSTTTYPRTPRHSVKPHSTSRDFPSISDLDRELQHLSSPYC